MDVIEFIGGNAGKVWTQLKEKSPLSSKQIASRAKIANDDVLCAIGWLAREGKIFIDTSGKTPKYGLLE